MYEVHTNGRCHTERPERCKLFISQVVNVKYEVHTNGRCHTGRLERCKLSISQVINVKYEVHTNDFYLDIADDQ